MAQTLIKARLRKTVTSAVLGTMKTLGAFSRAGGSEERRNKLAILCYHGISIDDEHQWMTKLFITPEDFRGRLQALRDMGAKVLRTGAALEDFF